MYSIIVLRGILNKFGGEKYPGGKRVSCFIYKALSQNRATKISQEDFKAFGKCHKLESEQISVSVL